MIQNLLAAVLLVSGVAFIVIAALGVARMPDVLQRMHSATKAGGIGATFVVLGVLVLGDVVRPASGILTITFMLLTLSVASQLLARSAYVSGARLKGMEGRDALNGALERAAEPLE